MLEIKKSEYRENIEAFAIAVVAILFILIFVAQSFLVKGTSMDPTLQDGERLIVDKITYKFRSPKTGEIIVFKYPGDPSKKFIKRVIGEPGDSVSIRDSKVYVNYQPLEEPYILEKMDSDYDNVEVPDGTIFVLGDNRNGSRDSRYPDVGFVPLKNVVGRADLIFWPLTKFKILFNPHNKKDTSSINEFSDYQFE
jgi:signal peptidase I